MPPVDSSPKPGAEAVPSPMEGEQADADALDDAPDQPQQMAAEIEDEESDPVIDSGPGITDGVAHPHFPRQ